MAKMLQNQHNLLILVLISVILLTQQIVHIEASIPDYDADDFSTSYSSGGGGGNSENDSIKTSEEFYDPSVLQQEIDKEHQRNIQNEMNIDMDMDMEKSTQTVPSMRESIRNISNKHMAKIKNQVVNVKEPTEIDIKIKMPMMSSDEYLDDRDISDTTISTVTTTIIATDKPPKQLMGTTLIPEYVRKGKVYLPNEHTKSIMSKEDDMGDYTDEEEEHDDIDGLKSEKSYKQNVPIPMKFYQNNPMQSKESYDSNKHQPNTIVMSTPQPLRPSSQGKQDMKPQDVHHDQHKHSKHHHNITYDNSSDANDDDYYEDSMENMEQQVSQTIPTINANVMTSAPTATVTMPTTIMKNEQIIPNIAIARAIPFFSTFNKSWNATTTTTTPVTIQTAATTTTTTAPLTLSMTSTTTSPSPAQTTFKQPSASSSTPLISPITGLSSESTSSLTTTTTAAAALAASASADATTKPGANSNHNGNNVNGIITNKQGKQINISRRKLLPHEQLRNYIEDAYIRMPLAVIIDPSIESLEKTKTLWTDALQRTTLNIKIILVSLNDSGIPAAYTFNNTRQFLAGLNSIKEHNGGDAFIGVVHASELVPYDSAVFISTALIPPHTELVQDAAITLLKKRIRLYLMWYGERSVSENETQEAVGGILGEVAIRSGGDILHIVGSANSQEVDGDNALILVADAFRGSQEVDIPVDTTLSSLHVKIDSPMRTATLETPNGDINLRKLVKFKSHILTLGVDDKRLDAYVPLIKVRKSMIYKLKLRPENLNDEYTVFVRADRKADHFLDAMIKRFDSFFMDSLSLYPTRFHDTRLQSITTALAAATVISHDNLRFEDENEKDEMKSTNPKSEVETFSEFEIYDKKTPESNSNVSASVVNPRDQNVDVLQRNGATNIVMGLQSQVLIAPGMVGQLFFELTNTRNSPIYHTIQVTDEKKFLIRLSPQTVFLRPGETVVVSVSTLVPIGTQQGTIDHITFSCMGTESTSLSINLKVMTSSDIQDTTSPSIWWKFGSRCDNVPFTDNPSCSDRFWSLDVTAQDWETGILRLQSTPSSGLLYRNSYTVGSMEPLKATYLASCCEPKVTLTAIDLSGNQRTYNVDVRDLVLTEAAIAAIVLGVILLIIIIIAIIMGIVWCCRRRKMTLELPTYRSHSTRSME